MKESTQFRLPEDLYSPGAPVAIAAGELQKDAQTGMPQVTLTLRTLAGGGGG